MAKKNKSVLSRIIKWLLITIAGAMVTTLVGAFVNDGVGDTNLFRLFMGGLSTAWSCVVTLLKGLSWLSRTWGFAFCLGLVSGAIMMLWWLRREAKTETIAGTRYANPDYSERYNLAEYLKQMASWAEHGFCDNYHGPGSFNDTTSGAWYVKRETSTEAMVAGLEQCGIFIPNQFQALVRNQTLPRAVEVYTRIASLIELGQFEKARTEFPKPLTIEQNCCI